MPIVQRKLRPQDFSKNAEAPAQSWLNDDQLIDFMDVWRALDAASGAHDFNKAQSIFLVSFLLSHEKLRSGYDLPDDLALGGVSHTVSYLEYASQNDFSKMMIRSKEVSHAFALAQFEMNNIGLFFDGVGYIRESINKTAVVCA